PARLPKCYSVPRFDVTDILRTDCRECTRFTRNTVRPVLPAEHQRTHAVVIERHRETVLMQNHKSECAFQLFQGLLYSVFTFFKSFFSCTFFTAEEMCEHFRIRSRLENRSLILECTP